MLYRSRAAVLRSFVCVTATFAVGAGWMSGCSGSDSTPIDSGDGSADDSGGGEAGDGGDAGEGACTKLRAAVNQLRPAAQACSNPGGNGECGAQVDDVCCPISVTDRNSQPVKDFEKAVRAYSDACRIACPLTVCDREPSKSCIKGPEGGGICAARHQG